MMKGFRPILVALAIGLTVPACLVSATGRVRGGALVVYEEPPAPRVETYQPRAGAVWVKGRWDWRGGRWMWVDGHWENERVGYYWEEGQWVRRGNSWHWV
jgi:hypothetical protein